MIHAHWAIPTGPAAVLAARKLGLPSVITMHGGDVYVNPEQGYDFPTRWYVRPAAPLDPAPRGRAHRHHRGLPAARPPRRRAGRVRSAWCSTAPTSADSARARSGKPRAIRASARSMIFACRQLFPREGHPLPDRGGRAAQAALPRPQGGGGGRRLRASRADPAGREARHRRRRHLPRLGARTPSCRRTTAPPRCR